MLDGLSSSPGRFAIKVGDLRENLFLRHSSIWHIVKNAMFACHKCDKYKYSLVSYQTYRTITARFQLFQLSYLLFLVETSRL